MYKVDDAKLIELVQSGNLDAFEEFVERYQSRLLSFVIRSCREEKLAEEIVQDTFLNFYKTIDRVDVNKKVSTYIFQIAKNMTYNHLRRVKRTVPLEKVSDLDSGHNVLDNLLVDEDKRNIKMMLSRLDKKYREVIKLYYFDELSYKEIGSKLVISLNTIKTRIRRGKMYLRKELETK